VVTFLLVSSPQPYMNYLSSIGATCPAHLILIDLIILIMLEMSTIYEDSDYATFSNFL
jgi:hypothetical protein